MDIRQIALDHLAYLRGAHGRVALAVDSGPIGDFRAGMLGALETAHDHLAEALGVDDRLGPQSIGEAIKQGLAPRVDLRIVHLEQRRGVVE